MNKYDNEAISEVVDKLSDLRDYYIESLAKIMRITEQLKLEDDPNVVEMMQAEITDTSDNYAETMPGLLDELGVAMRSLPGGINQRNLIRAILPATLIRSIKRKDHTLAP